MGVGETFVALAGIAMLTVLGIIGMTTGGKRRKHKLLLEQAALHERNLVEMQADIRTLKDRVRVLEKLATDPEQRLAQEIDRLGPSGPTPPR